jgi:hypothetical protein
MSKESGSKLNVELGDKYLITANAYSFILVERKTIKTGVRAGQEQLVNCGYFQTLANIGKFLITKELRESELTSLQQLSDRIEELGTGIGGMLEQLLKQSEGK